MTDLQRIRAELKDENPLIRLDAALELAKEGSAEGRDEMLLALSHERSDVRLQAIYFLGLVGAPWTIETIAPFARDPDPSIRNEAIFALAHVGRVAVVPLLIDALNDEDPERREDARVALVTIVGDAIAPVLTLPEFEEDDEDDEVESARAFWDANSARFDSETVYDRGEPVSPQRWIEELPSLKEAASVVNEDLRNWTGADVGEHAPAELAKRWRTWWRANGSRFIPGVRYFWGRPVESFFSPSEPRRRR